MSAALYCPRCAQPLLVATAGGSTLHGCSRCGGLWVDHQAAQRVVHALDEAALQLSDDAARAAQLAVELKSSVACPVCGAGLVRQLAPLARVEIDRCERDGTWFDRNELTQVARALAASRAYGGVAVAGAAAGATAQALTATQAPAANLLREVDADTVVDALEIADVGVTALDVAIGLFSFLAD